MISSLICRWKTNAYPTNLGPVSHTWAMSGGSTQLLFRQLKRKSCYFLQLYFNCDVLTWPSPTKRNSSSNHTCRIQNAPIRNNIQYSILFEIYQRISFPAEPDDDAAVTGVHRTKQPSTKQQKLMQLKYLQPSIK